MAYEIDFQGFESNGLLGAMGHHALRFGKNATRVTTSEISTQEFSDESEHPALFPVDKAFEVIRAVIDEIDQLPKIKW